MSDPTSHDDHEAVMDQIASSIDEDITLPDNCRQTSPTQESEQPPSEPPVSHFDLGTPDLQIYEFRASALAAAYLHDRRQGYDVARKYPKKNAAGEQRSFRLSCKRYGSLDNTRNLTAESRTRLNSSSKKIGCAFYLLATALDANNLNGPWQLRLGEGSSNHNHPADLPSNLPGHRQRDILPLRQKICDMTDSGVPTRAILSFTRNQAISDGLPESAMTSRDIHNLRYQNQQYRLSADFPTPICYAIKMLVDDLGYHVDYQVDESGQLKHLLMIHPDSLRLSRDHAADILMLDCTYRTNMYNQTLLNIIGATGSNSTINLGVAILTGETASNFHPVIQALSQFLGEAHPRLVITDRQLALTNVLDRCLPDIPHLLCLWHINKDVLAHARSPSPRLS